MLLLLTASASRHSFDELLDLVCGLWASATNAEELVDDADERLFSKIRHCAHHVLDELLPSTSDSQHNLRKRRHNLTHPQRKDIYLLKTLLLDYCTETPTDFHPGFLVT